MKITLESTAEIVELVATSEVTGTRPDTGVHCRVWEGRTDAGVPVRALIAMVAVERTEDQKAFERELIEKHPKADVPRVFPTRMIL